MGTKKQMRSLGGALRSLLTSGPLDTFPLVCGPTQKTRRVRLNNSGKQSMAIRAPLKKKTGHLRPQRRKD